MRLGEQLVRDGAITREQLDAALRTQAQYGGRIGSVLVRLGWLDPDLLSAALGKQLGVPIATKKHFDAVDRAAIAAVPARVAERLRVIPLGWSAEKQALVVMEDPRDLRAIDELSTLLRARVRPCVAPAMRIEAALKRFYDVAPASARFVDLTPAVPEVEIAPPASNARPSLSMPPVKAAPQPALSMPPIEEEEPAPLSAVLTADEACRILEVTTTRDEVGDAIVDFLGSHFRVGLLYKVVKGAPVIWKGFAPFFSEIAAIPAPSFLARAPFVGAPDDPEFFRVLRCEPPSLAVVMPIAIESRVVSYIYGHGEPGALLPRWAVDETKRIAEEATWAYVRILKASRSTERDARADAPTPPGSARRER